MSKEFVNTNEAPLPIGPYNQAVKAGGFVFTSGQICFDPKTNQLISGGIREQTRQVLLNLQAILKAAGTDMGRVIKTTVYLKDMNDFAAMNEVYGEFLIASSPARSTVEVARLPKDVLVEIECVALL